MLKKIIVIFFFSICTNNFSQIGGQSVYRFLSLVNSPRQAALGGKIVSFHDNDVNQTLFNPAAINTEMSDKFGVNYGSYFGEVTYGTACYVKSFGEKKRTFSLGFTYINYGDFDGYDQFGQNTNQFGANEVAISLGYSYKIPNSDFYFGANAKFISSSLETYKSFGIASDLGVIYKDEESAINYAITIRNVGTQLSTYSGKNEKLPTEILFGISRDLKNIPVRWHFTLENLQQWNVAFENPNRAVASIEGDTTPEKVSFFNNALRHVILGAELFPKKSFNLRLGYNFRRSEELSIVDQRNFSGFCAGFGLKMNRLKFNYSYSRYTLAANTSLFGLTVDLGNQD